MPSLICEIVHKFNKYTDQMLFTEHHKSSYIEGVKKIKECVFINDFQTGWDNEVKLCRWSTSKNGIILVL